MKGVVCRSNKTLKIEGFNWNITIALKKLAGHVIK